MASLTATLSQPYQALVNQACQFTSIVTNPNTNADNITNIQPVVMGPNGTPIPPGSYYISPVQVTPEVAVAQLAGSQLNVQVTGSSGTQTFTFSVIFYGPVIPGSPTQPNMQFLVSVNYQAATNGGFVSGQVLVPVGQPQFGQAQWVQPAGASSPPPVGSLQYNVPSNSNLLF
jgi:hypothetical protein